MGAKIYQFAYYPTEDRTNMTTKRKQFQSNCHHFQQNPLRNKLLSPIPKALHLLAFFLPRYAYRLLSRIACICPELHSQKKSPQHLGTEELWALHFVKREATLPNPRKQKSDANEVCWCDVHSPDFSEWPLLAALPCDPHPCKGSPTAWHRYPNRMEEQVLRLVGPPR